MKGMDHPYGSWSCAGGAWMMTDQDFEQVIRRLEAKARSHPVAYKIRVGCWALVGYGYIALVLGLVIGGIVFLSYLVSTSIGLGGLLGKAILALIFFAVLILRALWVKFPPPKGLRLTRKECPRLFGLVDGLRRDLKCPRFHRLLLNTELNAAISQVPRLGILGWPRNYLVIGLPLLQGLTPGQFNAVLAHEMGHISGNHGKFSAWIYRVRQTWLKLLEQLALVDHWGNSVFSGFFDWYAPYFSAYSFVQARAQEYEADRSAATLTGKDNMAEALMKVEILSGQLNDSYWPQVLSKVGVDPSPPESVFKDLGRTVSSPIESSKIQEWLSRALALETGTVDTHPCLRDRLLALGIHAERLAAAPFAEMCSSIASPDTGTAAVEYLGQGGNALVESLDQEWKEKIAPAWEAEFIGRQESHRRFKALEERAESGQWTIDELWEHATLTETFKGWEDALPMVQTVLTRAPNHPYANFRMGMKLLDEGNPEGIGRLEVAIAGAPDCTYLGYEGIVNFLANQGRLKEAEAYREAGGERLVLVMQAQEEREAISPDAPFAPHNLPADQVTRIREELAQQDLVKEGYLVQRRVTLLPEYPWYVLAVFPDYSWFKLRYREKEGKLKDTLQARINLPGSVIVVGGDESRGLWRRSLKKVSDSEVYKRK